MRHPFQPLRPASLEPLHSATVLNARWKGNIKKQWKRSKCYTHTMQYDSHLLKGSYFDFSDTLPQSLVILLLHIRTGLVPLTKHLCHICKVDSPICPCF
jgi:hypothetical protein